MTTQTSIIVDDICAEIEIDENSTISKTLHQDERSKVVLFGFAPGQELSEHTASVPAVMHFLEGEAKVTLGADAAEELDVGPHAWIHMPAHLPHSITAKTPVKMLLTLLRARSS